jgi:importin-9
VFYSCIERLEMVKDDHNEAVNGFAKESLDVWVPFFIDVLNKSLPDNDSEHYNGLVAFKIQVIRVRR